MQGKSGLIWVFLGWNLKKLLSYLKSALSSLSNGKTSQKNPKRLHLGPKMPSFFEKLEFSKKCCHITNQHPEFCLIAKFCKKPKMPKFGSKNALFGYFWTRI